jgi:hypothetical protein
MEHTNDLEFTLGILNNRKKDLLALKNIIKDQDSYHHRQIMDKLNSINSALEVLYTKTWKPGEYEFALTIIKANLNWLNRQLEVVPSSKETIDEIEYVSKLLGDGKD